MVVVDGTMGASRKMEGLAHPAVLRPRFDAIDEDALAPGSFDGARASFL